MYPVHEAAMCLLHLLILLCSRISLLLQIEVVLQSLIAETSWIALQEAKTETSINEAVDDSLKSMVAEAAEGARNMDTERTGPVDDLPLAEEHTRPEAVAAAATKTSSRQEQERQVQGLGDQEGPSKQNDKQGQEQVDESITKPHKAVVIIPRLSAPALDAPMWMVESFLASHVARWKAHQEAETVNSILHWLALGGTGPGIAHFCNDTRCSGLRAARQWQGAYRRCLAALSTSPPGQPSQEDILTVCIEAEQRAWMGSFRPGTRLLAAAAKLDLTRLGGNFVGVFAIDPDKVFGDSEGAPKAAMKRADSPLALTHEELAQKIQSAVRVSNELQKRRLGSMRDDALSLSPIDEEDAELNALHLKGVERLARAIASDEERRVAPGGANSVQFTPSIHIDPSYGETPAAALRCLSPYAARAAELLVKKLFTCDGALEAPGGQHGSSSDGNSAAFPLMGPDFSGMMSSIDGSTTGLADERMLPSSISKIPVSPGSLRTYASDAIVHQAWNTEFSPLPLREWGEIGEAKDVSADKWAETLRGGAADNKGRESQWVTEISTRVPWDVLPELAVKLDRTEERQDAIARHRAEKWAQTGGEMPPMQRMRRIRRMTDRFRRLYGHLNVRLPVEMVAMELPYGTAETLVQQKMTQSTRSWIDSLRAHPGHRTTPGYRRPKKRMDFSGPSSMEMLLTRVISEDTLTEAQRAVWEHRMQRWPGGEMPADLKVERMTSLATRFREKYQRQQSSRDGSAVNRYQRVASWPPWPIYTASYGAFYPSLQWIGLRPGSGTMDIEASESDAMLEDLLVEITMADSGGSEQQQQGGADAGYETGPRTWATADELSESDSVLDVLLANLETDEEKDSRPGLVWKQEVSFCHCALRVGYSP